MKKIKIVLLAMLVLAMSVVPTFAYNDDESDIILYNSGKFIVNYSSEFFIENSDGVILANEVATELNQLIEDRFISYDETTDEIIKLKRRVRRDVEPGEWKQIAYFSHESVDKITSIAGISGAGFTLRGLLDYVKTAIKTKAISTTGTLTLLIDAMIFVGISNMNSACEDSGHNGAYLHRYGNNNVFMFSDKANIGY